VKATRETKRHACTTDKWYALCKERSAAKQQSLIETGKAAQATEWPFVMWSGAVSSRRLFCPPSMGESKKGGEPMDASLQTILEAALQQGIWAALYIYLFFRMLKENATREERYQQMIDHLSNDIADGIEDIQNRLDALSPAASGKT